MPVTLRVMSFVLMIKRNVNKICSFGFESASSLDTALSVWTLSVQCTVSSLGQRNLSKLQ